MVRPRTRRHRQFESLESRQLLAADLRINEFLAINDGGLADEDGDTSDWIELHNAGDMAANLDGYFLTDDSADLDKWRLPAVTLDAGAYLIVFASDKDRADPAHALHTNFKLDGDGEYLGLVEPDGSTIVDDFSPEFPEQLENVSYGIGQVATAIIAPGATARYFVPANDILGASWTTAAYDDTSWPSATTGVGFEADTVTAPASEVTIYQTAAGVVGSQNYGGSLGHDFHVNSSVTVTKLGVFDSGSNGLSTTLTAQIWNRNGNTGTLLAQQQFTPASPGTLVGGDRFKPLATPLVLAPGDYTIVGYGYNSAELNGNDGVAPPIPGQKATNSAGGKISFVGTSRFGAAGQFPTTPDGGPANRYSAGTFTVEGSSTATVGQAQVLAYHNLPGAPGTQDFGGSLGHDFTVNTAISVTRLGVFDSGADGLAVPLTAQLWSRTGNSGNLITQLVFTPGDPGELVGSDRLKSLPALITLPPGEYTMVGYGYNAAEPNGNEGTGGPLSSSKQLNTGGGQISFTGTGRYGAAGAFPDSPDGGPANRYSAGVFEFTAPAYSDLIGTDIELAMHHQNASAYVRVPFTVADPQSLASLVLSMKYDDGFVAYLNGVEVARRNAPPTLTFNSSATASRAVNEARSGEAINLTSSLHLLQPGANVLAIHGLNQSATDIDFLLLPELMAATAPSGEPLYFSAATPGAANTAGFFGRVADTRFSVDRGFFDAPFDVTIATDTPGTTIRYTTDGTTPTETNGTAYNGPLHVAETTTLRAAAFKSGFQPSGVDTQTYLFLDDVLLQSGIPAGYPATWSGTNADYAMSQNAADLPLIAGDASLSVDQSRAIIKDALKTLPTMSLVLAPGDMFDPVNGIYTNPGQRGPAWERPLSVEYLLPDGGDGFQIDAGVRIAGFSSRDPNLTPKHSLRLFFRDQYGDAKLNYPLFPDTEIAEFNQISLRANARDSWLAEYGATIATNSYIRDQWAKQAQADMGVLALSGRFVHLYINGIYWGVYNPTESPDASFAATHLGGEKEDYDVVKFCCATDVEDGNIAAWNTLYQLATIGFADNAAYQAIQGNFPDGTRNPAIEKLLDVDNLIDFMLNGFYHASVDWPGNWYGMRRRGPDSDGFQFVTWDNDLGMPNGNPFADKTGFDFFDDNSPGHIDQGLRQNAEYRLSFADHAQRHLFNGADLTPGPAAQRWTELSDLMRTPLIAESARWGDHRRDVNPQGPPQLYTPSNQWEPVISQFLTSYFPQRTGILLGQLRAAGLYPNVDAPVFSRHGGTISPGDSLTMSAAAGAIYYTLDGSDPRLLGGAISPTASTYAGAIALNESTRVKARARSASGEWSALEEAMFYSALPALRITEVMYHPADPAPGAAFMPDDFEYLELQNTGGSPLDLNGFRIAGGVAFDFSTSAVTTLAPGEHLLVVNNFAAFASRYNSAGVRIAGEFTGQLDNNRETLELLGPLDQPMLSFEYRDSWYRITDGEGYSLVVVDAQADVASWGDKTGWRPSDQAGGSPGAFDNGLAPGSVGINEALARSTNPAFGDQIELHNTTLTSIDIGGWYLSNDAANLTKFRLPTPTVLPPGGYLVLTQATHFGNAANSAAITPFSLDDVAGGIYLSSADTVGNIAGYREQVRYEGSEPGETFGRQPIADGTADFVPQSSPSLGATNSGPRIDAIVLHELMYHPAGANHEYIELRNTAATMTQLFDPLHPDHAWRIDGAVEFDFPPGATIPGLSFALVVGIDPAEFRTKYAVPLDVPVFGPWTGNLSDGGEHVRLYRPAAPVGDIIPLRLADHVEYDEKAPWPATADGQGAALNRLSPFAYGNDVANWVSSTLGGSPGTPNTNLDTTPPSVPTGLAASAIQVGRIDLTWNRSTDAQSSVTEYRIYRGGIQIGTSDTNSFRDLSVVTGVTYAYQVSAVNASGYESARSEPPVTTALVGIAAAAAPDEGHVIVRFSEPLQASSAENRANYAIGGATILGATLGADGQSVTLVTTTLTIGFDYPLLVSDIVATSGHLTPAGLSTTFARALLTDGLRVWLPADVPSGASVTDASGNNNHATLAGATYTADHPAVFASGSSLSFGGAASAALVEPPAANTNINTGSVFAWIKTSQNVADYRGIAVKQQAFGLFTHSGRLTTYDWTANVTTISGPVITDGQWHHVGMTFASGATNGSTLYVDGVAVGTTTITVLSQGEGVILGAGDNPATSQRFSGQIDDVRLYARRLTPLDVQSLYANAAGDSYPPAVVGVALGGSASAAGAIVLVDGSGAQLRSAPRSGINQISLTFSEAVTANQGDLTLVAPNGVRLASGFSSNPGALAGTYVATWTFASPLEPGQYVVTLDDAVHDGANLALDGEWDNPSGAADFASDRFPSGDGTPGGDFSFQFAVLPGDFSGDEQVGLADLALLQSRFGTSTGPGGANPAAVGDINDDGTVDRADVARLIHYFGRSQTAPLPSPAAEALIAAATERGLRPTLIARRSSAATSRTNCNVMHEEAVDAVFATSLSISRDRHTSRRQVRQLLR